MFAEELAGNATRKRQEQARQRRRQLKQEQRRSNASLTSAAKTPPTVSQPNATVDPSGKDEVGRPSEVVSTAQPNEVPGEIMSQKSNSAVQQALQQRRLRQELQLRIRSATAIQSFYRAFSSNCHLLEKERGVLNKRLSDLAILRNVLRKAGKGTPEYAPPPATATSMVTQLLFLTRKIQYKRSAEIVLVRREEDRRILRQTLLSVLLPGMQGSDDNMDPILPWISDVSGQIRFLNLVRLCLICLTTRAADKDILGSLDRFIRNLLGVNFYARPTVVAFSRSVLLCCSRGRTEKVVQQAPTTSVVRERGHPVVGSSLDIIQVLRSHLLFQAGGGVPIPTQAVKERASLGSQSDRAQADVIFQLVLDAVVAAPTVFEAQSLQARFVAEIFSVPVLTFKTSPHSVSKLLADAPKATVVETSIAASCRITFISMLASFAEENASVLSSRQIDSVLPKVNLREIPATSTQTMIANLVELGRLCKSVNGSDVGLLNDEACEIFFNVLTTLLDVVPLSTFSSRETAVEWLSDGKGHHSPVVMSPVIINQCRLLLVDSFLRDLFIAAIDTDSLKTEDVLRTKTEKDLKHEKDLMAAGTTSAAGLAAREARMDRTKGFWQSKWARNLSSRMSNILSSEGGSSNARSSNKGPGMLVDTSSVSLQLANGSATTNVARAVLASEKEVIEDKSFASRTEKTSHYSPRLLFAVSRMCCVLLARWGVGGGKDERNVRGDAKRRDDAVGVADPCVLSLLNVLCFSTEMVKASWSIIQSDKATITDVYAIVNAERGNLPVRCTNILPSYGTGRESRNRNGAIILYMFVCVLSHTLIVTDDTEMHEMEQPLPLHQIRRCIHLLKKLLYRSCCVDNVATNTADDEESSYFGLSLISSSARTLRDLYDRSSRRPLCVPKLFLVDDLLEKEIRRCKDHCSYVALLSLPVCRICPFLVSFKRRLKIFERIITTNRVDRQGGSDIFSQKPGIPIRITRGRVLEDGLLTMNNLGRNLRDRIVVQYMNEAGAKEIGVDAGGLFKEFWTDLSALAFDPNYALFRVAEDSSNCIYPNPSSKAAHGPDHVVLFEFLGRILGKALYEGITIHPQFAHFFLSFLRGDYNYLNMLPDLSTMDSQLYNNLMFLKTYDGDATDLCLTFTVANDDFGNNQEVPLVPNGSSIEVNNGNKHRYIGLVAKYHVHDRLREQSEAFTRGLWDVIDRDWICLFNEPELQVLISGSTEWKIDINDMRSNTRYVGGYTGLDRTIHKFWKVVSSFNSKQQAQLLRFVTSCERPPPLGFASMNPPFTIQRVGMLRDNGQLPTASTCFNTLKLPTYGSEKLLRERMLYAIESGAGFELT